MGSLFQWEWIIVELLVLAALVWEYIKTRRLIRESRARRAREALTPPAAACGTAASSAPPD
jgi:heme exporter protein D